MIKKIICLITVLAMILSLITVPSVAAEEESKNNFRFSHLVNLGIMSEETDPDYIVTRRDFVKILSSMYDGSYDSIKNSMDLGFSDVSRDADYYDALVDCVCLEIINGYADGTFRPDKAVTVNEAIKVAVTMAGYNMAAVYKGGWTLGYVTVAKEIGILKNFSAESYNSNITAKELSVILYNLLLCRLNDITIVEEDTYFYTPSSETFAERNRDLVHISGVVNGNEYTNFSKVHSTIPYGKISVDDTLLVISEEADKELVGHNCDIFYDKDSSKIISAVVNSEKDNTLYLTSMDISTANGNIINYYDENGNEKKVTVPSGAFNIYNGKFVLSCDYSSIFPAKDATINFVDNNNDGKYDVVIVEEYRTAVVNRRNADYTVTDKLNLSNIINLDKESFENYKLTDDSNEPVEFSYISENDVISAVENKNYLKASVTRKTIVGVYKGTDEKNSHMTAMIDGSENLFVAKSYIPYLDSSLMGKTVTAYLDCLGNIAFMTLNVTDVYDVGYLIKAELKNENIEKKLYLKLLTKDNKITTFNVKENFKLDDVYTTLSSLTDTPAALKKAYPIRYKVSEELITDIDTPADYYSGVEDGFFKGAVLTPSGSGMKKSIYTNQTSSFNGVIEVGGSTVVFSVPANPALASDDDYFVYNNGFVGSGTYGNTEAYYYSRENQVADVIVLDSPFNITYDSNHGVVSKMTKTINADGESMYKVSYHDGASEKFFYEKLTNPKGIAVGDIVKVVLDADSNVKAIDVLYDLSAKPKVVSPVSKHYSDSFCVFSGFAGLIRDGKVRRSETADAQNDTEIFKQYLFDLTKFKIVIIEERNGNYIVSGGKASDVNAGDYFNATLRGGNPRVFFVYK